MVSALRVETVHATGAILADAGGLVVFVAAAGSMTTTLLGTDLGTGHEIIMLD